MFCCLNKGIAYCASPPTCQVLLLDVPFILLIYNKKRYPLFDSRPPNPLPTTFIPPLPPGKFFCYRCHSYFLFTKNGILFLILVPPTPSPLLSCLPSHLASSSVRGAIHTSYMKRNSLFVKENYKSAKCNIAFELKRLLVNQRRIHLLT